MRMFFILYLLLIVSVTPQFIFLIWLCMTAVAYNEGCIYLFTGSLTIEVLDMMCYFLPLFDRPKINIIFSIRSQY